jgi:hypothetical protein
MNRKATLLLASICLGAGVATAADLTVPAGQTYTVSAAQSDLRLDRLTLGDNARITFAPGVTSWRVYAKQASIGQDVVIDGRGAAGATGAAGLDRDDAAKDCDDGRAGGSGAPGLPGGKGVDLNLWWGIETLGSLAIQADGGAGGAGGRGGRGQDGGKVNRCDGPRGGAGGEGGDGGAGGSGGAVAFSFAPSGKAASLTDRITVSSQGGSGGTGGAGGPGGAAKEGKFQRTTTGDRWFQGGQAGAAGRAGAAGVAGSNGAVTLQPAGDAAGPAWRNEISSAPVPAVAALQQQVQALQASTAVAPTAAGEPQSLPQLVQQLQRRIAELEARVEALEKQ